MAPQPLMTPDDHLDLYDYPLPAKQIATYPVEPRDHSRLMVYNRREDQIQDQFFHQLGEALAPGDLLVLNNTQVVPARLEAQRQSGGRVEVFLHPTGISDTIEHSTRCLALLKPAARITAGEILQVAGQGALRVVSPPGEELREVELMLPLEDLLLQGQLPLPPYIQRRADAADETRYQTVFAENKGAVAAPTAGLHFTPPLLQSLERQGIQHCFLTLHVGPGTFLPVRAHRLSEHQMHEEVYSISAEVWQQIEATKQAGGRVVAVGTTTTRALESAALLPTRDGQWQRTSLMIRPPYQFAVIDALVTNFHLPRSTLLALVSAFAGREKILALYQSAAKKQYRFYSYGDAMLLL